VPPSTTRRTKRHCQQVDYPREPPEIVYSGGDRPSRGNSGPAVALLKNICGADLDLAPLWALSTPQMRAPGRHLRTLPAFYALQWHIASADDFD